MLPATTSKARLWAMSLAREKVSGAKSTSRPIFTATLPAILSRTRRAAAKYREVSPGSMESAAPSARRVRWSRKQISESPRLSAARA